MPTETDHQDVLQNLEFAVARFYKSKPELTDFAVQQAYDSLLDKYGAEQRGTEPRHRDLNETQQELREVVEATCEFRLGRAEDADIPESELVDLPTLVRCLRKLQSSVKKWTKRNGRQGYLNFMSQYL